MNKPTFSVLATSLMALCTPQSSQAIGKNLWRIVETCGVKALNTANAPWNHMDLHLTSLRRDYWDAMISPPPVDQKSLSLKVATKEEPIHWTWTNVGGIPVPTDGYFATDWKNGTGRWYHYRLSPNFLEEYTASLKRP